MSDWKVFMIAIGLGACGSDPVHHLPDGPGGGSDSGGGLRVVDVSSWEGTTCAVISDGHVGCWGANMDGEVGDGTFDDAITPHLVTGLTTATQVSLGSRNACARLTDGSVRCWGADFAKQLGDGGTTSSPVPVAVPNVTTAVTVVAGGNYACALLTDATVTCWGGIGGAAPTALAGFTGIVAIDGDYSNLCGLTTTGTVTCTDETLTLTGVAQLALGDASRCVRFTDGSVSCWGQNTEGELGDATTNPHTAPAPVPGLTGVTDLASGQFHRCAVRTGPTDLVCWGEDNFGELGDGGATDVPTPIALTSAGGVAKFALGDEHSCALATSGAIECWGRNNQDQLGDNTMTDRGTPGPVVLPVP